jgi:ergothioneine biosynthesis protein EgtB
LSLIISPQGVDHRQKPDTDRLQAYRQVRRQSEILAEPLELEDFVVQSMPDASPVKWHLAHTTWFFETFLLKAIFPDYQPRFPQYNYLFNSYYNTIGERIARDKRGLLSRPSISEVQRYRQEIDARMEDWLATVDEPTLTRFAPILVLGLNHEQQHQELILTDLKHAFAGNPLRPIYRDREPDPPLAGPATPMTWSSFDAGVHPVGHPEGDGFAFDNESPRHSEYLEAFELANRPTTNREYLAFMADDGYDRPEFWLSDGWAARKRLGWTSPLYWEKLVGEWSTMTLAGMVRLHLDEPVTHVSFYEADAFARWAEARLPTEAEWETAYFLGQKPRIGLQPDLVNFLESARYHPAPISPDETGLIRMFGDVWEWTRSPYSPYPGYKPAAGALGEYNGKFMCNQMVLRGGSCASPILHIRATYRNFFGPEARWQFSGVRLARDLG